MYRIYALIKSPVERLQLLDAIRAELSVLCQTLEPTRHEFRRSLVHPRGRDLIASLLHTRLAFGLG